MKTLQAEHKEWADRVFPHQPPSLPAGVMVEEAGELMHAIAKLKQLDLYPDTARYSRGKLMESVRDALGDCGIICCSYCNATKRDFASLFILDRPPKGLDPLKLAAMLINRAVDVVLAGWALDSDLMSYITILSGIADHYGMQLTACIRSTWLTVKERSR